MRIENLFMEAKKEVLGNVTKEQLVQAYKNLDVFQRETIVDTLKERVYIKTLELLITNRENLDNVGRAEVFLIKLNAKDGLGKCIEELNRLATTYNQFSANTLIQRFGLVVKMQKIEDKYSLKYSINLQQVNKIALKRALREYIIENICDTSKLVEEIEKAIA